MQFIRRVAGAGVGVLASLALVVSPASAVDVPTPEEIQDLPASAVELIETAADPDYGPDYGILTAATDPCGKRSPMRYGAYDVRSQRGWGWYKMFFKHNLGKYDPWEATVESSCGNLKANSDGTTWDYRAIFVLEECDSNGNCEVVDSTRLVTIIQRKVTDRGRKGMITTYCTTGQECPEWLNSYDKSVDRTTASTRVLLLSIGDDSVNVPYKYEDTSGE
jgi:hypothetical protein